MIWSNFGIQNRIGQKHKIKSESLNPRRWECDQCPYVTTHGGHFTQHRKIHDKSSRLQCQFCSYSAARKWHLKEHIKHAHTDAGEREPVQESDFKIIRFILDTVGFARIFGQNLPIFSPNLGKFGLTSYHLNVSEFRNWRAFEFFQLLMFFKSTVEF